jgi:hypothetical protein
MENVFVYLVCKKLLEEPNFANWTVLWEDSYPEPNSGWRCDIVMVNKKPPPSKEPSDIPGPWDFVEFGYYSAKSIGRYVDKLKELKNFNGFEYGGRYIVIFNHYRKGGEGKESVRQKIQREYYFDKGIIELTSKTIPQVPIQKYYWDDGKKRWDRGIFEIAFLRIKERRRAS